MCCSQCIDVLNKDMLVLLSVADAGMNLRSGVQGWSL